MSRLVGRSVSLTISRSISNLIGRLAGRLVVLARAATTAAVTASASTLRVDIIGVVASNLHLVVVYLELPRAFYNLSILRKKKQSLIASRNMYKQVSGILFTIFFKFSKKSIF